MPKSATAALFGFHHGICNAKSRSPEPSQISKRNLYCGPHFPSNLLIYLTFLNNSYLLKYKNRYLALVEKSEPPDGGGALLTMGR